MRAPLFAFGLVAAFVLAGCAANKATESNADVGDVDATETTGGIHGIVVDQAIRPLAKVLITVGGPDKKNTTTDDKGTFVINGLKPGTYLLKATKPLYDATQQSVEVVAGVRDPKDVKIQLTQVVFDKPYMETLKFNGFLTCSQDFAGVLVSEECGEGVGSPRTTCDEGLPPPCVDNPVLPGQRIGHQDGNTPQFDFYPSAKRIQSLVVELNWQPTVGVVTTGQLWTVVATNFYCTPTCGGDNVINYDKFDNCAKSPSYLRDDKNVQSLNLTTSTRISTFTWACGGGGTVPYDLEFQQKYEEYVTMSYVLPLPDGWSFIKGDKNPFK
jgi:hypothetical protein